MNPIFSFILNQLPNLLPVVESLVKKKAAAKQDDGRLVAVEQSLELLAERSDYLEGKIRRLTYLVIVALFLSFVALIMALVR